MSNVSGINPVGNRLLLKPIEIQEKSSGGIILATDSLKEREQMANTTGIVVAMGDDCYSDERAPWCKVGDKITFAKYAGLMYMGRDSNHYRMINDKDVTGTLDEDVDIVDLHLAVK
jgi:chaperonin GroES